MSMETPQQRGRPDFSKRIIGRVGDPDAVPLVDLPSEERVRKIASSFEQPISSRVPAPPDISPKQPSVEAQIGAQRIRRPLESRRIDVPPPLEIDLIKRIQEIDGELATFHENMSSSDIQSISELEDLRMALKHGLVALEQHQRPSERFIQYVRGLEERSASKIRDAFESGDAKALERARFIHRGITDFFKRYESLIADQ